MLITILGTAAPAANGEEEDESLQAEPGMQVDTEVRETAR